MQVRLPLHSLVAFENYFEVELSQFLRPTCATGWSTEWFYYVPIAKCSAIGHDGKPALAEK